jgi:DNA (cytosine-5)-methyltransferase 1
VILVDLFCGAGGMGRGFKEAGFEVLGIDIEPQPRYGGDDFQCEDAIAYLRWIVNSPEHLTAVDGFHASTPCQAYAPVTAWRGDRASHPDYVAEVRRLLEETGKPWVMENVPEPPLRADLTLCGTMFALPIRRHRVFETNWPIKRHPADCTHRREDYAFDHGAKQPESIYREAMECSWMTVRESRQAIPPRYAEFIGRQLKTYIEASGVAPA